MRWIPVSIFGMSLFLMWTADVRMIVPTSSFYDGFSWYMCGYRSTGQEELLRCPTSSDQLIIHPNVDWTLHGLSGLGLIIDSKCSWTCRDGVISFSYRMSSGSGEKPKPNCWCLEDLVPTTRAFWAQNAVVFSARSMSDAWNPSHSAEGGQDCCILLLCNIDELWHTITAVHYLIWYDLIMLLILILQHLNIKVQHIIYTINILCLTMFYQGQLQKNVGLGQGRKFGCWGKGPNVPPPPRAPVLARDPNINQKWQTVVSLFGLNWRGSYTHLITSCWIWRSDISKHQPQRWVIEVI